MFSRNITYLFASSPEVSLLVALSAAAAALAVRRISAYLSGRKRRCGESA